MSKELLFSVTAKDCDWQFFCAGGNGGQHQNKTASACRCIHRDSGAVGISRDHREQRRNKVEAFKRMSQTKQFQHWYKIKAAKCLVSAEEEKRRAAALEMAVTNMMKDEHILVQIKEGGKWIDWDDAKIVKDEDDNSC